MRTERFTEKCPVELTPEEIRHRGVELSAKLGSLYAHQEQAKIEKAALAAKEKEIQLKIKELHTTINTRREERPVVCYERADHARLLIEIVRTDTGEVLRTRPMDDAEKSKSRQGELFDVTDREGAQAFPTRREAKEPTGYTPAEPVAEPDAPAPGEPLGQPVLDPETAARLSAELAAAGGDLTPEDEVPGELPEDDEAAPEGLH